MIGDNFTAKEFDQFEASELYCPRCGRAQPVVKKLLLILPDGELYDYNCRICGTSVGSKKVMKKKVSSQIIIEGI